MDAKERGGGGLFVSISIVQSVCSYIYVWVFPWFVSRAARL